MPPPPGLSLPNGAAFDYNPGIDAAWAAGWTQAEGRAAIDSWDLGEFLPGYQLGRDVTRYSPVHAAVVQRVALPMGVEWYVEGRFDRAAAEELWETQIEPILGETLHDLALYNFTVWQHPIEWDADAQRWVCRSVSIWPLAAVGLFYVDSVVPRGYHARVRPDRVMVADEPRDVPAPLPVYYHLPRPGQTDGQFTVLGAGRYPHLFAPIRCLPSPYVGGEMSERDRANLSKTIGRTAPVGVMPPETPVASEVNGQPAQPGTTAMEKVIGDLGVGRAGAVIPHGGDVKAFTPATGEASLFSDWLNDRIKLIALAILGRGGSVAKTDAQYQGPIESDVPESIVRADVAAVQRAVCGLFARLYMLNHGARAGAPVLVGPMLDSDQDSRRKAKAEQMAAYQRALDAEAARGTLTPDRDAALADWHEVPRLPVAPAPVAPAPPTPPTTPRAPMPAAP